MDVAALLSFPVTWVVTAGTVVYCVYWYGTRAFKFFRQQGIPGPKPVPLVGNLWGIWKETMPKHDRTMIKKYGKVVGYFEGTVPNLWTTDLDVIKAVYIKNFDHFINRRAFGSNIKVIRKMVFTAKGQEWKDIRSSITPAFTSGKIKRMSVMIQECTERLVTKLNEIAENEGKLDAKRQFSAFTMDVIARCVFGMTIDNIGENDDPFVAKAKDMFNFPASKSPAILLALMLPTLSTYLAGRFFLAKGFDFFVQILEDLIKQRSNSNEKFHDIVEVTTEAIIEYTKQANDKAIPKWNKSEVDEIVVAQSVLFFLAGFDTTATTLTNASILLTQNPEVQEKLYEEIMSRYEEFGEISHEIIADFPYAEHVIHEVLRMCPPVPRVERVCNKDFTHNNIAFKKGMLVTVPAFALHYDEDYYPEPEKFNPDRWSPDNEEKPSPYAFTPFGMGPRNCIGMRFAMEEMKIALCQIVKNFRFFPVAETPEKIEFEEGYLNIVRPINSIVGIEVR